MNFIKAREIRRNIILLNEWKRLTNLLFDNPDRPQTDWEFMQGRALVHELHRTQTGRAVMEKFLARGDL